jgi:circadian clock protein KaiB
VNTERKSARAKATRAKPAAERSRAKPHQQRYALHLYVAGMTSRSASAVANIKEICEEHLDGLYDLRVIDLYQHPALAEGEQIVALPTLIRKLPPPLRRMIGDLSNREQVLIGLDLLPKR